MAKGKFGTNMVSALAATATIITTAPASVLPRQSASQFNLTNFYVAGQPHSSATFYSFAVTDGITTASCGAVTYSGPQSIPAVPATCCGTSCDWQWSFSYATGPQSGYNLNILHVKAGVNEVSIRFFPSSDVQIRVNQANPTGNVAFLDSPTAFSAPYTSLPMSLTCGIQG